MSSSKRKWDQPADELAHKAQRADDGKSASEAAAAAAAASASAIAAKITAQFASSSGGGGGGATGVLLGPRDPYDGAFVHDVDINDVRNRYLLTRASTQEEIREETGASVTTKGVWYPDRSKATDRDPPLYLHISASSQDSLDKAAKKIEELIAMDMGSLVENKDVRKERRKWPEAKLPVGLESLRNFNVRARVVGPAGTFVKYIQQETNTRVQIKGIGSGFIDNETNRESDEPMHIHITGPDEAQVSRARVLTEDLLEVVRIEHGKAAQAAQQQQMELRQAQVAYAAYAGYGGYSAQPPSGPAPPPPPGDAPPPPPGAPPADGSQPPLPAGSPPAASDTDAYAAYWAAYGYDVNSPQFKEWLAQSQQQYAQYYAQNGYGGAASTAPISPPAPGASASPPPPPPPQPANEPAPPPPPPS